VQGGRVSEKSTGSAGDFGMTITGQIFLNLGYVLFVLAMAVHDILWLRSILTLGEFSLIAYGVATSNMSVVIWNTLFVTINSVQVIRILLERRPIQLPSDLVDLYENLFSVMSTREFFYFWQTGTVNQAADALVINAGEPQKNISLILSGTINIVKEGTVVSRRSRGDFIGEMSFSTRNPASADVMAEGCVQYISWEQEKLRNLKQLNPQLLIKIQSVLEKNLAHKMSGA
jgi:hypothetical protein